MVFVNCPQCHGEFHDRSTTEEVLVECSDRIKRQRADLSAELASANEYIANLEQNAPLEAMRTMAAWLRDSRAALAETQDKLIDAERDRDTYRTVADTAIAAGEELRAELEVTNKLLDERNRLLGHIPGCGVHGACIPHAIEWVQAFKDLEAQRDRLLKMLLLVLPDCFICPDCGPLIRADEDGCCSTCGAECSISPTQEALAAKEPR